MIVVMNCGPGEMHCREMHCRALKCLTYMTPSLSAGALKGGQQVIAGLLRPKSRNGIFMEHEDADPRALVPLVGPSTPAIISKSNPAQKAGRTYSPAAGEVLGGAGLPPPRRPVTEEPGRFTTPYKSPQRRTERGDGEGKQTQPENKRTSAESASSRANHRPHQILENPSAPATADSCTPSNRPSPQHSHSIKTALRIIFVERIDVNSLYVHLFS